MKQIKLSRRHLCIIVLLIVAGIWGIGTHKTKERPFISMDALVREVPTIKAYFQDKIPLLNEVHGIFTSHSDEFYRVERRGKDIIVYYERAGSDKRESLSDSELFSEEEKQKIADLFCENGPIYDYYGSYMIDTTNVMMGTNVTGMQIVFLREDEVADTARISYYSEEFADHWFICVTIGLSFVDRKYVERHKAGLPGQGLVRLRG